MVKNSCLYDGSFLGGDVEKELLAIEYSSSECLLVCKAAGVLAAWFSCCVLLCFRREVEALIIRYTLNES